MADIIPLRYQRSGSDTIGLSEMRSGETIGLAQGGTGASLTDPNADRILFWDDSAGAFTWLTAGTNLIISGTTIDGPTLTGYTLKSADANQDMNNYAISEIKTATFNSQGTLTTTTGAVSIDWTAAQNYKQDEPTGTITYTFTNPPGPCHLQLLIDSDGTSTAQTINWPTLTWIGATWTGANNKKAIINLWFDGTNYFAQGANQV